ncbi:MAG: serine/threonine-protein kinase, partial [Cyanobacteria bacterium J06632_3]
MNQPQLLDGRYRIVKKLNEGGFGVTYLACDTRRPGEPLCVAKELRHEHQSNPKVIQLFHQEAEILERLGRHNQIPQLLAAFHQSNRLYLVQEYIDGATVYDELTSPLGKLKKTEKEVVALLRDVLTALKFVHQNQVVHRDIKPANLMRRRRDGKIMLIDFGAVKALAKSQIDTHGQMTTVSIGSPGYSPFEQLSQANPCPASDIYALGITAIEALTGLHPTELGTDPETLEIVWQDRTQVTPGFAALLTQMVHFHYARRFRNAEEALEELERTISTSAQDAVALHTIPPPVTSAHLPPVDFKPRRDVLKFLGFSAAGMLVALGSQQLLRERATSERAQSDPTLPDADGSSSSADLTAVSDSVEPSPSAQSGAGSPET